MSCNSCSNVTLPGVAGPAGAAGDNGEDGADGNGIVSITLDSTVGNVDTYEITYTESSPTTFDVTNGIDGVDGVPVLFMDTTGPNTASNNVTTSGYTPVRTGDTITGGTIGTVGDFIKIKGEVIADIVDGYTAGIRVKFGGSDMFEWFAGASSGNGIRFEIDLIVSGTDEITPHIKIDTYKSGYRAAQTMYDWIDGLSTVATSYTTTFSPGLSSDKDIVVEIDSDGTNTATLTYYEVTKYLKV